MNLRGIKRKATKQRNKEEIFKNRAKQSERRIARIKQLTTDLGPYWHPEPDKWTQANDIEEQLGLEKRDFIERDQFHLIRITIAIYLLLLDEDQQDVNVNEHILH